MSLPESGLTGSTVRPFWAVWLDVVGDPMWVTTRPGGWSPTGTGDPDLDGKTFTFLPPDVVAISPVTLGSGGADQVQATLGAIPVADAALLTALADRSTYHGRVARFWRGLRDASGAVTYVEGYFTGYLTKISVRAQPDKDGNPAFQTATATIENYLSFLTQPRRRTYQNQREHDPLDQSAERIRAAANGAGSPTGIEPGGGGGGQGGGRGQIENYDKQF